MMFSVYFTRASSRTGAISCKELVCPRFYATSSSSPHALLFIEHQNGALEPSSLSALTAAQQLGGSVTGLIVGSPEEVKGVVEKAKRRALRELTPNELFLTFGKS